MITRFKTTEKSVRVVEADNTIVVEVEMNAKKPQIKKSAEEMFNVKVKSVNTLIRANKKYAYIKLTEKFPAIDIATKFGLI